jgi:hypothetical protein
VAAVLVLNTPDDGSLRPKHVEWPYRNKTCTVLHQVGVSFDLWGESSYWKNNNRFPVRLLRLSHLSGELFGHQYPQTLSHLTSFCGYFLNERSTAINQQAWRSLRITFRRLIFYKTNFLH